jgi:ADP-heptose:LPS heptosyltransferase
MKGRFAAQLELLLRSGARRSLGGRRLAPVAPRRILVVPTLFIGDALFMAPLLAKLRQRYPSAEIRIAVARGVVPLFSGKPYGAEAFVHDPRDASGVRASPIAGRCDLALVAGDNRFGLLAAALGAGWIVAFAGDRPPYKNWFIDEFRPMSATPMAWGDMAATLADGEPPPPYRLGDWPAPGFVPFDKPAGRYAVLHVEASTPLKYWNDAGWLFLAESLLKNGIQPVWSAGPTGAELLRRIDPAARFPALGHKLDLAQLWHLVAGAALLVCPDTSVMHIGRLTGVPTVGLFGPSSPQLYGTGDFWRDMPFRALQIADLPGRDRLSLFKRAITWPQRPLKAVGAEEVARAALDCARHAV